MNHYLNDLIQALLYTDAKKQLFAAGTKNSILNKIHFKLRIFKNYN